MAISREEKILILSTKLPFPEENKSLVQELLLQKIDWGLLINLSASCGILPLMARNLLQIDSNLIPRLTLEETLKHYQMEYTLNHLILWNELKKVLKMAGQKHIPIMPFKGIILTEILYGNPIVRRTSDIDILVKKEYLPKIESELVNLKYLLHPFQVKNRDLTINRHFHFTFEKQNPRGSFVLDAHWDILPPVIKIDNLVNDFWNNAVIQNVQGEMILTLCYEDLLFESIIELYKETGGHYLGYTPFLLKRRLDISQILQLYGRKINWGAFIKRTNIYGLRGLVYYALTLNKELFDNCSLPQEILLKLKPSLCKRMFISKIPDRLDLSEKSLPLRRLIISLFISEVILLSNRWKVLFLRLFYHEVLDIYAYKKTNRINYIVYAILRCPYRLLLKISRKIFNQPAPTSP